MTQITFKRKDKIFYAIEVKGHSGHNTKGKDILCAAISALTQTLANFLLSLLANRTLIDYKVDENEPSLSFTIYNINYANDIRVQTAFLMTIDGLSMIYGEEDFAKYFNIAIVNEEGEV